MTLNARNVSLFGDFFRRSEGRVGWSQQADQCEGVDDDEVEKGDGAEEEGAYVSALGRGTGELGGDDAGVEVCELEDRDERDQVPEQLELDVDGREGTRSGISKTET